MWAFGGIGLVAGPAYAEYPPVPNYSQMAKQVRGSGLNTLKTAAGSLFCAGTLCTTTKPYDPQEGPPDLSLHTMRLARGGAAYQIACDGTTDGNCTFYMAPAPIEFGKARDKFNPVTIYGEAFIAPGDGCLYVVQYWNATHTSRQKYCPDKAHKLTLEGPELSYAGIQGSAKADIVLYESPDKGAKAFHTIKAKSFVEVVVATRTKAEQLQGPAEWYLLKDKFGLVGWASSEQLQVTQGDSLVRGLGFQGD